MRAYVLQPYVATISLVNSIYLGEPIYIMEGLLRRVSLDGGQLCLTTTCMTVKRRTCEGITHQIWFYMQLLDRLALYIKSEAPRGWLSPSSVAFCMLCSHWIMSMSPGFDDAMVSRKQVQGSNNALLICWLHRGAPALKREWDLSVR